MNTPDHKAHTLSETLLNEIIKALALPQTWTVKQLIRLVFSRSTQRLAKLVIELDYIVETKGVAAGARWLLPKFVKSYSAHGVENIPTQGPLIIAANHPASYDGVVISAYITRPDYKIIIGETPFFKHLPHVSRNAIFTAPPNDATGRTKAVREIIRHLKNGGAILIFPRGGIEADPAFMPHADAEFHQWSRSLEIFLNQVPQTQVIVTMVGGVVAESSMRHPITWFRKARPDRQRIAYIYQVIRQMLAGRELYGLTPSVTFGDLISRNNTNSKEHMLETIINSAHNVLQTHVAQV